MGKLSVVISPNGYTLTKHMLRFRAWEATDNVAAQAPM